MQINTLVEQYNQSVNLGNKVPKGTKGIAQTASTVSKLASGQVFEGTVSSVKGDRVTLALTNGDSVKAKMTDGVSLSQGESVFFEVKSNSGTEVAIRPISLGTMNNPTLLSALDAASIPQTEKNLSMVNSMMSEQMPIDSASLQEMSRMAAQHPEMDTETLVLMKKLDIPVTEEMAQQFENYKAGESAVLDTVDSLTESFAEAFSDPKVKSEDILAFQKNLSLILTGEGPEMVETAVNNEEIPAEVVEAEAETAAGAEPQETEKTAAKLQPESPEKPVVIGNNASPETAGAAAVNTKDEPQKAAADMVKPETTITITPAEDDPEVAKLLSQIPGEEAPKLPDGAVGNRLSGDQIKNLEAMLKDLGVKTEKLTPETDAAKLFKQISDQLFEKPDLAKTDLLKLLKDDSFKDLTRQVMEQRWTLKPEQIAEKDSVKKLFAQLSDDMERINGVAQQAAKGDNPISRDTAQIKSNVDFVNRINETYTYVQLPLKMAGQSATGDMYVYANKKRNITDQDEVSAFLHFDLDHLGSTDISVKMKGKAVDTRFFMEDDAAFDLIEANLPALQAKLDALGYNAKVYVENDAQPVDFVEDFLKQDAPTGGSLSRYSFDMKA